MITRRGLLTALGGTLATGAATGGYAFVVEPRLRLTVAEHRPAPAGWPADLPLSIAVLSDLHCGHVVEEGRHLIVSGGLGGSVLPVRFGVPPEITLVRLGEVQQF